jgi:hypothetical protein
MHSHPMLVSGLIVEHLPNVPNSCIQHFLTKPHHFLHL